MLSSKREPVSSSKERNNSSISNPHNAKPSNSESLITIFDFQQNPNKSTRINSPRSLAAIKQSGLYLSELIKISFEEFKRRDPNLISVSKDLQLHRYNFSEQIREDNIKAIIRIRESIIKNEYNNKNSSKLTNSRIMTTPLFFNTNKSTISALNMNKLDDNDFQSKRDEMELERMKAKNKKDLIDMITYELQKEAKQKEAEELHNRQMEKKREYEENLKKSRLLEAEQKKRRDYEKQKEEEMQLKIQMQKEMEQKELEKKKQKEKEEKERKRLKENEEKRKNEEKKRLEFQKKIDEMHEKIQEDAAIKMEEQKQKEIQRQKNIERLRGEKIKESEEKNKKKKKLIEINQRNLERKLQEINDMYKEKDQLNSKRHQDYIEKKQEELEKEKEANRKKESLMREKIETNEKLEMQKVERYYNEKQQLINMQKLNLEKRKREELQHKEKLKNEKDDKIKMKINKNELNSIKKIERIMQKIENKDKLVKNLREEKIRMNEMQINENIEKRYMKEERLKILERQRQNDRENIMNNLEEKNQRLREFKFIQMKKLELKKIQQNEMQKKKEEIQKEFHNLMDRKNIDDTTYNKLKQMFPDSPEIDDLIYKMKNPQLNVSNNNFSTNRSKNSLYNKSNNLTKSKSVTSGLQLNNYSNRAYSNTNNNKRFYLKKGGNETGKGHTEMRNNSLDNIKVEGMEKKGRKKEKLSMEQINNLVKEYKTSVKKELSDLLREEKDKEKKREEIKNKLKTEKEKKDIEKTFGKERAIAEQKIISKNNEMELKVEAYKKKLMKENGYI